MRVRMSQQQFQTLLKRYRLGAVGSRLYAHLYRGTGDDDQSVRVTTVGDLYTKLEFGEWELEIGQD